MRQLIDTLAELSIDPFAQDAFARDPEDYLHATALAPGVGAALVQRDWRQLEAALQTGSWARTAFLGDPGPDPFPDIDPASTDV